MQKISKQEGCSIHQLQNSSTTGEMEQSLNHLCPDCLRNYSLPIYISEVQASKLSGLSVHWFRRKRWAGGGPKYLKLGGGTVRYPLQPLLSWLEERIK